MCKTCRFDLRFQSGSDKILKIVIEIRPHHLGSSYGQTASSHFTFVWLLYEPTDTRPGSLQEEEVQKQQQQLQEDRQEWQRKKEEYQKDLERLRDAQRKLERDKEAVQRQFDKMGDVRLSEVRKTSGNFL